ncbi:MAG: hypothetical protein L6366_06225, partial [Candidatus Omnitrophica bacterium]|nr:hypothetical protein [Candidatus Omnitrophota bacterium]
MHNIVDYSFFISQAACVWWVFMSNIIVWDKKEIEEPAQNRGAGVFLKNCFACLAISLICFNYMDYAAEINLKRAEYLAKQKKYTLALSSVRKSLKFRINNDNAYYVSALLLRISDSRTFSPDVVDNYLKAIFLNPQYSFYPYELGKYFYEYGKAKEAKYFFERACRLYPTNPRFKAALDKISYP